MIYFIQLTRSIRDSETSIDFVQGPPGSRRERVNVMMFMAYRLSGRDPGFSYNLKRSPIEIRDQWRILEGRRRNRRPLFYSNSFIRMLKIKAQTARESIETTLQLPGPLSGPWPLAKVSSVPFSSTLPPPPPPLNEILDPPQATVVTFGRGTFTVVPGLYKRGKTLDPLITT